MGSMTKERETIKTDKAVFRKDYIEIFRLKNIIIMKTTNSKD